MQRNFKNAGLRLFKSSEAVLFIVSDENGEELLNIGKCSRLNRFFRNTSRLYQTPHSYNNIVPIEYPSRFDSKKGSLENKTQMPRWFSWMS